MSVTLGASKKPERSAPKKKQKGFYESKNKADKKEPFFKAETTVKPDEATEETKEIGRAHV